jgi:hypothetical protein
LRILAATMLRSATTPNPESPGKLELQQLLQGECAQGDAETLVYHVEGCESCQELLQTLDVPDVLVQAARAGACRPSATPPQDLARLMAHLARMAPQSMGSKDTGWPFLRTVAAPSPRAWTALHGCGIWKAARPAKGAVRKVVYNG